MNKKRKLLGEGSYGQVYAGLASDGRGKVAVKKCLFETATGKESNSPQSLPANLLREISILNDLRCSWPKKEKILFFSSLLLT
jgi:serine/threonine protein kinase